MFERRFKIKQRDKDEILNEYITYLNKYVSYLKNDLKSSQTQKMIKFKMSMISNLCNKIIDMKSSSKIYIEFKKRLFRVENKLKKQNQNNKINNKNIKRDRENDQDEFSSQIKIFDRDQNQNQNNKNDDQNYKLYQNQRNNNQNQNRDRENEKNRDRDRERDNNRERERENRENFNDLSIIENNEIIFNFDQQRIHDEREKVDFCFKCDNTKH